MPGPISQQQRSGSLPPPSQGIPALSAGVRPPVQRHATAAVAGPKQGCLLFRPPVPRWGSHRAGALHRAGNASASSRLRNAVLTCF